MKMENDLATAAADLGEMVDDFAKQRGLTKGEVVASLELVKLAIFVREFAEPLLKSSGSIHAND
jgi:hypothetical protein